MSLYHCSCTSRIPLWPCRGKSWRTQKNIFKLSKSLFTTTTTCRKPSAERKKVWKLRWPRQLDKKGNISWWEKDELTQILNFFPSSNMLVRWVASKVSFGAPPPKIGLVNVRLYIFLTGVQLYVFTLSCLANNCYKSHKSSLHSRLSCRGQKHPLLLAPHMRKRYLDLQFFQVIFNYHECFCLVIIYLFIQFQFSMNHTITSVSSINPIEAWVLKYKIQRKSGFTLTSKSI